MKVIGIIPSRYNSTRFPGKPLANILGKSMIKRVYEQCQKCSLLNELIVATDDERILNHVQNYGGNVMMTSIRHKSGTDRCNEIIKKLNNRYDIIVNIQGDEPYINPKQIEQVINLFSEPTTQIATLARRIDDFEIYNDHNSPKVIFDENKIVIDFLRNTSDLSKNNYYQHIGIYGYTTEVLLKLCKLPQSKNEKKYSLEQLRWVDNDYKIKVGITEFNSLSIDTPEDIIKIKSQIG